MMGLAAIKDAIAAKIGSHAGIESLKRIVENPYLRGCGQMARRTSLQ
jgi:hypothetical protein